MLSTTWLFICLLADLAIGFVLGWVAHASRQTSASTDVRVAFEPDNSADGKTLRTGRRRTARRANAESKSEGCRVLDDLTRDVDQHAETLNDLHHSLESRDDALPEGQDVVSLPERIQHARDANRDMEASLEAKTTSLSRLDIADTEGIRALLSRLGGYRDKTHELTALLEGSELETDAAALRSQLLQPVLDLIEANHTLGLELLAARRTIAEQESRLKEAEFDARTDPLTKLPNRRAFEEKVLELRAHYERSGRRFGMIMFDVDHFKALNDTYGHVAGDATLAVIGRVLCNHARAYDHVSRFGGEEFAILLPDTSLDQLAAAAERFRKQIERTVVRCGDRQLRVTISGGGAEGVDPEDVLSRADAGLYAAKSAGRNQVHIHDGTMARPAALFNLIGASESAGVR